jgi:hypothetical protein
MSNALIPSNSAQLPAHLQARAIANKQARATNSELSQGVTAGFPVISYRGKVWRIRKGGVEKSYLDAEGEPVPSIEIVLVRSNAQPSKTYYDKKYEEGDNSPPTCWSTDGFKPDHDVREPQSKSCAICPHSQWGSRITESGKKGRACSDVRRVAAVFTHELMAKGADAHVFLLRIPPASLNPLKDYSERVLDPRGVEYFSVATRVGFDTEAAHPKFTFKLNGFLPEDAFEAVLALRDSPEVARMLTEGAEFAGAGTTGDAEATGADEIARPAPSKAAPTPTPAARKVVEDEEVEAEVVDEPPPVARKAAPPPLPAFDDEEEEEEPEVAPPPPKAKAKKKATAPAAAPTAPAKEAKTDFDSMLESLLK